MENEEKQEGERKLTREEWEKALEQFKWILACQAHDKKYDDVISADSGLKLERLPIYEPEEEEEWIPSGKINPNEWRLK